MYTDQGGYAMPYILAVSGLKDSGKTTLCTELLERLRKRGYRVGYAKHSSHSLESSENTDTGKIRARGIPTVYFSSGAVLLELGEDSPAQYTLSRCFLQEDLVLLEGGKHFPFPRIWVGPRETVPEDVKGIMAYWNRFAEDSEDPSEYGAGGEERLADRIEKLLVSRDKEPLEVFVGNRKLPMKSFVGDFIAGGIRGMLGSLKGYLPGSSGALSLFLREEKKSEETPEDLTTPE
jgi:molybdopterin-guanine dinucleotide biosynthesis protein B